MNVSQFHRSEAGQKLVFWLTLSVLGISLAHSLRSLAK